MHWSDEGLVLAARRHGENGAIIELLTRQHGRHLGLIRGGRSRTMRPVLQPGNILAVSWQARLEEHLGNYAVEPLLFRAASLMDDPMSLAGLNVLTGLSQLLPEREPHGRLYLAARLVLEHLGDSNLWPALLVRWELGLLDELGFGLDLTRCAATGSRDNLLYVSPKSGRAVSRTAGEPYRDKLLRLPEFLCGSQASSPTREDLRAGFVLTGHFLGRHLLEPRGIPPLDARQWLIDRLSG